MSASEKKRDSTDVLLPLGGLVVAGIGLSWLLLSKPWEALSGDERAVPAPVTAVQPAAAEPAEAADPEDSITSARLEPAAGVGAPEPGLDDPLKMARLAFEAGMLVEPAGYSAWSLYEQVLQDSPDDPEALNGLMRIADTLVSRAALALEQGRVSDAEAIVEQILATLPAHDGAVDLAAELGQSVARVAPRETRASAPPAPEVVRAKPAPVAIVETPKIEQPPVAEEPAPEPEPPPVDPLIELGAGFEQAMADNRLVAPAGDSAIHYVDAMVEVDPEAPSVAEARTRLFSELLIRASVATEALDAEGALTWIDAADAVGGDPGAVNQARSLLTERLIRAESMKPFPASQLEILEYVAPRYPSRASSRNVEGWVDVEFYVTTEGTTRDVTVTDASHEIYFKDEAVEAVERWIFEPRVFMGQTIDQRANIRIRFDIE